VAASPASRCAFTSFICASESFGFFAMASSIAPLRPTWQLRSDAVPGGEEQAGAQGKHLLHGFSSLLGKAARVYCKPANNAAPRAIPRIPS
jgi:hypothetical protein